MDDKLGQEVYDLINKAQAEMDAAKDKIKLPAGGGITGPIKP